jgi:hypothetical protein
MQDQLLLQRLAVLEARVAQIEQQTTAAKPLDQPELPTEPTIMVEPPPMPSPPSQPEVAQSVGNPYWLRRVERERRESQPQPPVKPLEKQQAPQPPPELTDPLEAPPRLDPEERGELAQERGRRKAAELKIHMAQSPDEIYELTHTEYLRRQQWADEYRGQTERRQAAEEPLIMKPQPPAQQEQPAQPQPAPAPEPRRAATRTPWTSGPTTIPTIDESSHTGPRLPQSLVREGPGRDNDEIPHQTFGEATIGFANRTGRLLASMAEQLSQLSRRIEELESAREMESHE